MSNARAANLDDTRYNTATNTSSTNEEKLKHINPFVAFIILWTTEKKEDITTLLPLHKRIYRLLSLFRKNLIKIFVESCQKGIIPKLAQYSVVLLQAASVAVSMQSATATAEIMLFYQFTLFACFCYFAIEALNQYARFQLKSEHLKTKVIDTKELIANQSEKDPLEHINTYNTTPEEEKIRDQQKPYQDARSNDNNPDLSSDLGEQFSKTTRKMISFFIDCAIFTALIGHSMLIVALIATGTIAIITSSLSAELPSYKGELTNVVKNAKHLETHASEKYSAEAITESKKIPKISLLINYIKRLTNLVKNASKELSYSFALVYYSFFVLYGQMNPALAVMSASIFQQVFQDLIDYPDVLLDRQKFKSSIDTQLSAIYDLNDTFLEDQHQTLSAPYFPNNFTVNILARSYIYLVSLSIVIGLLLIPAPAIMPTIVSFLSSYSYQELALYATSIWFTSAIGFALINGSNYQAENTTSFYLFSTLLFGATVLSSVYLQAIFATYAHIPWTIGMYAKAALTLLATYCFDACFFQYFAFAIDSICICLSQELVLFLQLPINFTSHANKLIKTNSYTTAKYFYDGTRNILDHYFEESTAKATPATCTPAPA